MRTDRRQGLAAGILIFAIGLSVRFPITSVSPILDRIGDDYGLSTTGIAALSAIPVLLFGLAAPLAPWLAAKFGAGRATSILLATLAVATLLRPLNAPLLFLGTVVVGATIALLGILAPQIVSQAFPARVGLWAGVYTTAFGLSAASGAALAVPILMLFGEQTSAALAAWGIPLLIAAGLALAMGSRVDRHAQAGTTRSLHSKTSERAARTGTAAGTGEDRGGRVSRPSIWRAPGLWVVTGFFGFQAVVYFSLTSWLPIIVMDRGMPAADAGLLLAWMSIAGLPASLLAPMLASRPKLRMPLTGATGVVAVVGLLGLAFAPLAVAPAMVVLLGLAQSAAFGLSIAMIVFTTPSLAQTASFSAISQGVGYAFAAAGPLLMGLLAGAGVPWSTVVALLAAAGVGEGVFGVLASRASLSAHKKAGQIRRSDPPSS